jgi:hypothetical protein
MSKNQNSRSKWTWLITGLILAILVALVYYILLKPKALKLVSLPNGECYANINGKDPKNYLKLYVRYKTDDFTSFDLAAFQFNNKEYVKASCMNKTSDNDGYLFNAFVPISNSGNEIPFLSVVSSPVKPFSYSLEVIAISTSGDTLVKYKKDTTLLKSHTFNYLKGTVKLK